MNTLQVPKWLLPLIFCLPVLAVAGAKARSTDSSTLPTVQPEAVTMGAETSQSARYPRRGMTMKQVRKQFGKPRSTRKSTGKVKKKWPRITVWNYGKFSVYFERHITLHTVVH